MSDPSITRRLVVSGRVQGVGYRVFLTREAHAAGVTGWVRNRRDGTVEALLQGPVAAVERVIARARIGPATGRVSDLIVEEAAGTFTGFSTLPTE